MSEHGWVKIYGCPVKLIKVAMDDYIKHTISRVELEPEWLVGASINVWAVTLHFLQSTETFYFKNRKDAEDLSRKIDKQVEDYNNEKI